MELAKHNVSTRIFVFMQFRLQKQKAFNGAFQTLLPGGFVGILKIENMKLASGRMMTLRKVFCSNANNIPNAISCETKKL